LCIFWSGGGGRPQKLNHPIEHHRLKIHENLVRFSLEIYSQSDGLLSLLASNLCFFHRKSREIRD